MKKQVISKIAFAILATLALCMAASMTIFASDHASASVIMPGDINGDSLVNVDDAIYLLRYTFKPDNYPISQSTDVNGDGSTNVDDAIYLLRHTFKSEDYPILGCEHTLAYHAPKPATCTEDGNIEHWLCSACDRIFADEEAITELDNTIVSAFGHTKIIDAVIEPTCTEQGYTTYTCECGDSYVADYVDALGHIYENGICTGCGAEHPNLANYEDKVISILGDSISTFAGYIPVADGFNLQHYARYPQDNLFTEVEHTWWMQVLTALDAKLGINESWRSTEVGNIYDVEVNSGYEGTKACMASITRIQNLGSNGTPDVILFYGGTNDITQRRTVGTFNPVTAPTEVDLTSVKWDTVADAYVAAIMRMQHYYPNAEIIAMLPAFTSKNTDAVIEEYNSVFAAICEHYGVTYIDLRDCAITTANLPDGTHPDETGMDYITAAVLDILLTDCNVEAGEHIVHSVTHNLAGAESSLSYYKGISHGKSYVTEITGEDLTVTVTMDGVDITSNCYANGIVSITNVTGDVVITATGREKTIYDDHLQQLPDNLCCGMNLWNMLTPENQYYTTSGWGNLSTGQAWSITIPVTAGDRIYANSFGKNGSNGNNYSSTSGIRVAYFDAKGVFKSLTPAVVYAEFAANGYLTIPEDVVAVCVPMWTNTDESAVYVLSADHTYENGICAGCGAEEYDRIIN